MGSVRIISRESTAFADRQEAGAAVAEALQDLKGENPAVLGIPRGGLPVAAEIAERLGGDLDVVIVRKLRAPQNPELAIGSISEDGETFLDERLINRMNVSDDYLEEEKKRQMARIKDRRQRYRDVHEKVSLEDRVVVVTDDGLATGATMRAAVWAARTYDPARLIAAVPVGAEDSVNDLAEHADEVVCVHVPPYFGAVGAFYQRFTQVSDEEVVQILKAH